MSQIHYTQTNENITLIANNIQLIWSLFLVSGDKPRRVQTMDSYNRLFGELNRPTTPAKNHMRSSIPIGADGVDHKNGKLPSANGHGNGHTTNGKVTITNGNGVANLNGSTESGSTKSELF